VYQHARLAQKVDPSETGAQLKLGTIHAIHEAGLEVGVGGRPFALLTFRSQLGFPFLRLFLSESAAPLPTYAAFQPGRASSSSINSMNSFRALTSGRGSSRT
jgi:hypothetical protein